MDVESYLQSKLQTCASYSLTEADKRFLHEHGMEKYVYKDFTLFEECAIVVILIFMEVDVECCSLLIL
jgi:hypothetical protein